MIPALGAIKEQIGDLVSTWANAFASMKSTLLDLVGAFRPYQVELFTRRLQDLKAVLGQMLLPVLDFATAQVQRLSRYLYSLPQGFRDVVAVVGKVALVIGAVASAGAALGGIAAVLAPFFSVGGAVVAVFGALTYGLSQTSSGAKFFKELLAGVEQVIAAVAGAATRAWAGLAPLRAALDTQLSALGDSLRKLWAALKPVAVVGIGVAIKIALELIIRGLTWFARQLTSVAVWITRQVRKLGIDLQLPDMKRPDKDPFGLGSHGASISSDVVGFKNKIEEEIIANTGGGTEGGKEDKDREIADNTKQMADLQQDANQKLDRLIQNTQSRIEKELGWAANHGVFGAAGLIFGP